MFELGEFFGIALERRFQGRWHVVLHKPISPWVIRLCIKMGFGITILLFESDFAKNSYLRAYRVRTESHECQKYIDKILFASTQVESLQIRMSGRYNLRALERLDRLQDLYIGPKLANKVNLGNSVSLRTLWLRGSNYRLISGLSQSKLLESVWVDRPSEEFLWDLPSSISNLHIHGSIDLNRVKSRFPTLSELGIHGVSGLVLLKTLRMPSLKILTLDAVKEISGLEHLKEVFPNLEILSLYSLKIELRRSLVNHSPSGCQVEQDSTPPR